MTNSGQSSSAYGRIFVGPEPADGGPHPGYRGLITVDGAWLHLDEGEAEFLSIRPNAQRGYPDHDWQPVERNISLSASAVSLIEWGEN